MKQTRLNRIKPSLHPVLRKKYLRMTNRNKTRSKRQSLPKRMNLKPGPKYAKVCRLQVILVYLIGVRTPQENVRPRLRPRLTPRGRKRSPEKSLNLSRKANLNQARPSLYYQRVPYPSLLTPLFLSANQEAPWYHF